jgi:nitrous oxide reductase accessory protein NosL
MKQFAAAILITLIAASSMAWGADQKFVKPSPKDKCPVCGMFVAKYPDFAAQFIFKDGSYALFDGTKDMFKYYFNLKKYAPSKTLEEISSVYVTDYYSLEPIDGITAWYVEGSDTFGPMGKELIPFSKESDARGFMKDHKGKSLLRFKDVHAELIRGLD